MAKSVTKNYVLRAELVEILTNYIQSNALTQKNAAVMLGVTQPRISDLTLGKIDLFSLDTLINFVDTVGFKIALDIKLPKAKKPTLKKAGK